MKNHLTAAVSIALLLILNLNTIKAQSLVTYLGNQGKETIYDVLQLSDGTVLTCGYTENLDWVPGSVPITFLNTSGNIPNSLGTNRYGILLHFSADLSTLLHVVSFAQGKVEDVRFIKTTSLPYKETGDLFISCNTADTYQNDGGYIIAKLNGNFIDQVPDALVWHRVVWALSYAKEGHPWDVTSDGEVYYVSGEAHGYDWSAMYCLNQNGNRKPVENWRTHWLTDNSEWKGTPASENPLGSIQNVKWSGIVFKMTGRCELRSWNMTDFNLTLPDGNGGTKKGKWPADFLFSGPCDPNSPTANSPGYNQYMPENCCPVWGASSVAIDRRDNHVYLGMNFKSFYLPENTPDFEPAVIAFDQTGQLKWWSRLYHEITPQGDTVGSIPDQYVDALAIDYKNDLLVVGARSHGNNTENLWEGHQIAANPSAMGFQKQFTGTNGNIHESWLGKLRLSDATLMYSTYVAEYAEATSNFGAPHSDPNLDGWPDPNQGWPNVNTTRMTRNSLKTSSDGSVLFTAQGRRTITTASAYQKMVKPFYGGLSTWNSFVRLYHSDLSKPTYSTLLVGQWDTLTEQGGGNVEIYGVYKTNMGILAVGRHTASNGQYNGNPIPLANIPNWGTTAPSNESGIIAYFKDELLNNAGDLAQISGTEINSNQFEIFPNPADKTLCITAQANQEFVIRNLQGALIYSGFLTDEHTVFPIDSYLPGLYFIQIGKLTKRFVKMN